MKPNLSTHHILLIAKREYIKTVRKPVFWLATLLLPAFIIIVSIVSGYSAQVAENNVKKEAKQAHKIMVYDPSLMILDSFFVDPLERTTNIDDAKGEVINGSADALFVIPADIDTTMKVEVYSQDTGLLSIGKFDAMAKALVRQSVIAKVNPPELQTLLTNEVSVSSTYYKDGVISIFKFENFFIPGIAFIIYFMLVFMANNFLLTSVSEEKENRTIEIMISIVEKKNLVWGKLAGITAIALTQIIALSAISIVILYFSRESISIPINFSAITIEPIKIMLYLFYILAGFLIIASTMVGVGSIMPTYKDAQSFSSIFTIASIFPLYFFSIILQDPNGLISQIVSYFPYTSPLIFACRLALNSLTAIDILISIVLITTYIILSYFVAFKLFELGSLEYQEKITLKRIMGTIKNPFSR